MAVIFSQSAAIKGCDRFRGWKVDFGEIGVCFPFLNLIPISNHNQVDDIMLVSNYTLASDLLFSLYRVTLSFFLYPQ